MSQTATKTEWLKGKRVALAGRFACLSRQEAMRLVSAHGGIVARDVSRAPAIVIVGRNGWPLARDGRPARKLRRALAMTQQGREIEVVPEEELLARLHQPHHQFQRRFTLRELSQMLSISLERLQNWLRAGLIQPTQSVDGLHYFDFGQVAGAKSLCGLVQAGVSTARLRHSLASLQHWLGDVEAPLAQLTLLDHSHRLVIRLEDGQLAEPSGQLLLPFDGQAIDGRPASLPWLSEAKSAQQWFELGCQAEHDDEPQRAAHAFRQALLAGGPSAEICFNLANTLCTLHHFEAAAERYRQVLELDPNFWEAWNNLGTVLTYGNQNQEAVEAYRRALQLHPRYADAHYNLADTLEDLGHADEASGHWQAYLNLEPHGDAADYARTRLRRRPR